jgi:hypothetical protein
VNWTILWDMHRRPGRDGWSRAVESNEGEALQRAERFLKLGFVVYEIRDPKGLVVHDEAAIRRRFKPAPASESPSEQPPTSANTLGFIS